MSAHSSRRFEGPAEGALSGAQQQVFDKIAGGPRGQVVGPLKVWLTSPNMADRAQALGQFARYDSCLSPRQSELAILVTARIWSSGFEWSHHVPIALDAGHLAQVIEDIGLGKRPDLPDEVLRSVFDVAVGLHRDRAISDTVYAQAEAALGPQGLVDLVAICGYYTLISMTINAFEVPDGDGPALPELDVPPEKMFR